MPLPKLLTPPELIEAAEDEARHIVDRALDGMFGLIDAAIKRRQSYAFAHEQSLFHKFLAENLIATKIRIFRKEQKIRKHMRKHLRWDAKARGKDPELLARCTLCTEAS